MADRFNERLNKAAKILENSGGFVKPVEIEFGDETAGDSRNAPIKNIYKITGGEIAQPAGADILEYDLDGGVLLSCRVEEYNKGFALFADFLRDAKKYYKKTCISAKFIYFFSYRPMYRELNHEQLCWYLFWRSRVRAGDYIKTGLSYIFIYIFEQINLSDLIGAEKVYANIIKIWKAYRKEFPRIDKYITEWLIDFTLIHELKINLDDISDILPEIINLASLPEIYLKDDFFRDAANVELILDNLPVYNYKKSKFYSDKDGKNKDLFDYHVKKIIHAVLSSDAFANILAAEIADGVRVKATRESFMGAVCVHDYKKKITLEYKNLWKSFYIRELITNAVRCTENIIRDYLHIKSKLNVSTHTFPAELANIIKDYRDKYLAVVKPVKVSIKSRGKKKLDADDEPVMPPAEFAPDLQAAAEIERDSWATTAALLELQDKNTSFVGSSDDNSEGFEAIDTGEPEDLREHLREVAPESDSEIVGNGFHAVPLEDIFDVLDNIADDNAAVGHGSLTLQEGESDIARLVAALSADELAAVRMLAGGASADDISAEFMREFGVMLEALLEAVNERAVDITGDIIFENGFIIDDYAEEIGACLGG